MPELETVFVRIEADLSQFKRGIAEAKRETLGFANEARGTFATVGDALDLSRFRQELKKSDTAVKASADRMKKAYAEVGKELEKVLQQAVQNFARSPGGPTSNRPTKSSGKSDQSSDSSGGEFSDFFDIKEAVASAGFASLLAGFLATTLAGLTAPISAPTLAAFLAISAAIGGLTPSAVKIAKSLADQDPEASAKLEERIEDLRRTIEDLENNPPQGPRRPRPTGGPDQDDDALGKGQTELADALAERKTLLDLEKMANDEFLLELQRVFAETAAQNQEFLNALTGLPDSLNQFGGRIDNLIKELLGIAGDAAGRGQELLEAVAGLGDSLGRLCECLGEGPPPPPPPPGDPDASRPDGVRGGGPRDGIIPASFDPADSPFGGGGLDGLNVELADAGWRVQDLSAGFVELTEAAGGYEARAAALNALLGEQSGLIGQLLTQVPELGGQFSAFLERTSQEADTLKDVVDAVGQSFLNAFEGAIQRGESLGDVLKGLIVDLAEIALRAAGNAFIESFLSGFGGIFGGGGGGAFSTPTVFTAQGAAFKPGGVMARNIKRYARGGIVDSPEAFAFAHGLGVMGEAGPEAILPLARLASGELGVKALPPRAGGDAPPAGPSVTNVFNIDARSADRQGLRELTAVVRVLAARVEYNERTDAARAINAVLDSRRRGGNIARAFGAR